MPYGIRKHRAHPDRPCVQVYNKDTGKVHAECTSRERAEGQIRLLRAAEHNPGFKRRER